MRTLPRFFSQQTNGQRGLTLVELMIGMALGLIVLVGIGYIYMGSRQGYKVQDNMARIQENGRYAMEIFGQDIRMAGFMGCANLNLVTPNIIANNPPNFSAANALKGFDNGSGWTNPSTITRVAGTDVITIQSASPSGVTVTEKMNVVNANIQILGNPTCFAANDALFVSDCSGADIFRATTVSSCGNPSCPCSTGNITIAHANSANTSNNLSKTYGTDAEVLSFKSTTYFIGSNPAGNPALYRINTSGSAEELVDNVADMQLTFGEDTDGTGTVDQYVAAGSVTDWAKVLSVRVSLLLVSRENNVVDAPQRYVYNGSTVDPTDRRLRFVFTSTIGVRNRLL